MNFAIITGASKGLGASIAERMIMEKVGIISVSRTENKGLKELAAENQVFYQHFSCNLSLPEEIEMTFKKVLTTLESYDSKVVYVINNAGVIDPISTAGNLDHQALIQNVHINLIAPIMISNILLNNIKSKMKIVNVSSGAAENPYQGWSAYCSTKAGLNMFTKTAAAEQETIGSSHKIIAFSPGIMDTDMQGTIRSSSKEAFNDLEKFKEYKEKGLLRPAKVVASALVDLLMREPIESGKVYHVNELINNKY
ncbi:(S)-benzoin forming benzil reductase [Cytobacillus dafuensis]|uniref:(S)-benzoin forming benzil reductase n=1 Tax=Cytobacillus dafuensis TaxID=1742359 RepID=A0A5B8Z8I3_CYTDA|nr:(S)-benzoin forming benzil reductase [Cytobacillus dafuensis]